MMVQMHPPTLNPLTSLKNGARIGKQIPFLPARRPFPATIQEECQKILLPKISDSRGSLSFIEGGNHIPFKIESAHWFGDGAELTNDRGKSSRGRQEFIVAISGSIEVTYDNGRVKKGVCLDGPDAGLYVPNASCRQVRKLSADAVVLVLTSSPLPGKDSSADEPLKRRRFNDYRA